MSNQAYSLSDINPSELHTLAQLIENQRCALVLGPNATTDANGQPLHQLLAQYIAADFARKTGRQVAESGNLSLVGTAFLQEPDTPRLLLEILVRDFYKGHPEPNDLLREVARLPFPLVLTVSPDGLLQRAFLKEQLQFCEGVYRFSKTPVDDFDQTPAGQSYLYQLFGKFDERHNCDSMVLSIDDQLKYIDSVQGVGDETRLPKSLRKAMQQNFEALLFIGFDYENWYLKVLFHILEISAANKVKLIYGLPEGLSRNLSASSEAFFRQQYRFKFFKDEPLELLRSIRSHLKSGKTFDDTIDDKPLRTLLFLHAEEDQNLVEKLDRQLSQMKKQNGLCAKSIQDFAVGDTETVQNQLIDSATVIVPILSADFLSNDILFEKLTRRALSRQSESVCVAAVYAREVGGGVADFFKNHVVLPAHTIPLTWMEENTGLAKIAENLEKLTAVLK